MPYDMIREACLGKGSTSRARAVVALGRMKWEGKWRSRNDTQSGLGSVCSVDLFGLLSEGSSVHHVKGRSVLH